MTIIWVTIPRARRWPGIRSLGIESIIISWILEFPVISCVRLSPVFPKISMFVLPSVEGYCSVGSSGSTTFVVLRTIFGGKKRLGDIELLKALYLPFFRWGPPHKKQPPSRKVPPTFIGVGPPACTVVSWSSKCVYLVRLRFPKFFTCMTFGSRETSTVDSVASV